MTSGSFRVYFARLYQRNDKMIEFSKVVKNVHTGLVILTCVIAVAVAISNLLEKEPEIGKNPCKDESKLG